MMRNSSLSLVLLLIFFFLQQYSWAQLPRQIMTVKGMILADSLGFTLPHEHVFLDWSGADLVDPSSWNENDAVLTIRPYLDEMREQGVKSFLECTPAYLGRNPNLLLKLSSLTGLQVLTNTGFYGARSHQYIPAFATKLSSIEMAQIWIDEWQFGIEETGIKPGFIKIGVDSKDKLDSLDLKIVEAAALTHLATGLTIVAHTGDDTTAAQQIAILKNQGVDPSAFVWTHAQRGTSSGHMRLAKQGTWVSLDGLGWIAANRTEQLEKYVGQIKQMWNNNLLDRLLISHDAGWYTAGQADQSNFQPYREIFEYLIPRLIKEGLTGDDIETIFVHNPREAYTIKIRSL